MLRRLIIQSLISFAVQGAILFIAGDDWLWPQGWAFLGEVAAWSIAISWWLYRSDPELLKARMTSPFKAGQRSFDRVLIIAFSVLYLAWLALMGLDAHRFLWTAVPLWGQIVGALLLGIGMMLVWETFRANTFAAPQVRVQAERDQTVIDSGPYHYIRHPMYAGALLYLIGAPLIMGSLWGLAGTAVLAAGLALRILGEEKVLRAGLPGYDTYAKATPWRIIPGVW
jgi:protein-S-isoprenylcysteine O-methyltransferase Ste14